MSLYPITDLGSNVKVEPAGSQVDASGDTVILTAGATENGVEIDGPSIDRLNYDACILSIGAVATLADTETLAFGVKYQTSSDASTWDTAVVMQASTVVTALTGDGVSTSFHGSVELPLKLRSLKRYIRFQITPTMSASSTDTAVWSSTCVLAGTHTLPAA